MKYFIVFQNKTFKEEKGNGILWAPKSDKAGGPPKFHWKSMEQIAPGDVIFSIVNNHVISRNIAFTSAIDAKKPFENDSWNQNGWLVRCKYNLTSGKIKISEHIEELKEYLPDKYSAFNKNTGKGNQGYLFPISNELGEIIDYLIDDVLLFDEDENFSIDETTAGMIYKVFEEEKIESGEVILIETDAPVNRIINKKTHVHKKIFNKTDFYMKAKNDILIGNTAEKLVIEYEKDYLIKNNRPDLAEKIKWVSRGNDSAGFDIISYELNGTEKYIEVKGTTLGKNNPFEISINEVNQSETYPDKFWIYRVYNIKSNNPKFYKVKGNVSDNFKLITSVYKAYP